MGLMEKEMLICAVLIFITGGKQGVGSVSIRSCNTNMLDIRENTVNSIFCEGFNSSATIEWSVKKGTNANRPVATCDPSTCTVHAPVHFGARRSFNESHLTYLQYDRDVDRSANIVCESTSAGTATSASCALNVISWAVLTNCFIAYNSSLQKLVFSCEYAKAYSSIKSHSCTWFKKSQRGHTKFTGTIFRTYVSLRYTKGKCTLSLNGIGSWTPGKYIYSILFYPSSGEKNCF